MKINVKCTCGQEIEVNPAAMLGSIKSEKKAEASRNNGKKGGAKKTLSK